MAQVFVIRSDLQTEDQDNPVRVIATYRNDTVVDITWHGDQATVLSGIADKYVFNDRDNQRIVLASNWRDDYQPVVNGEAYRRINAVFPQYKQMNYTAQYNLYQAQYGTDTTQWPAGNPQDFLTEYNRGWQYISDVRTVSNSFTAMPVDPTDNSLWPTPITPIQ